MVSEPESGFALSEDEDAAIKVYLEARRSGIGEIRAARLVGCTKEEIERFARLNESFGLSLEEAVHESLERIEEKIKESAQDGDFQAAKLVLETHLPEKWIRPEREVLIKLGQPEEIDVAALHRKLQALSAGEIIDVDSEETPHADDDETPDE